MNGDLYTIDQDGTGRVQVTFGAHAQYPQFSPDGRTIAFFGSIGGHPYGIYLRKATGGAPVFLVENSYYLDRQTLSWSPNGSKLAFTCPPSGGICSINTDGSDFHVIDTNADDHAPDWSPDGSRIVFTRGAWGLEDEIYVMKANGADQRRLTVNLLPDAEPRWSADGKRIAFTHRDACFYSGNELFCFASYVWVMNSDGSKQISLYGGDILFDGGYALSPSWSPDGKVVFGAAVKVSETEFPADIFRIRPDGDGLINMTNTPDMSEGSPDWAQISPGDDDGSN
jgi:Tol biopolymer transport system component